MDDPDAVDEPIPLAIAVDFIFDECEFICCGVDHLMKQQKKNIFLFFFSIILLFITSGTVNAGTFNLVTDLDNDLESTFADWPAVVVLGGAMVATIVTTRDSDWQNSLGHEHLSHSFDNVLDKTGSVYAIDGGAALLYGVGRLSHNSQLTNTGETLLEALLLTEASVGGLKLIFDRTRPDGGSYSFPSGHAARTFAVASALETLHGPKVGIPAFALAGLISFSRLDSNEHFPSDVIFGAAWGAALGWGTAEVHKDRNHRVVFLPLTTPHSQGFVAVLEF